MFQDDALFPHRDVAANIAFGLRMQGAGRAEQASTGRRSCSRSSGSRGASTGPWRRSRAASESASRSRARSLRRHACSCSTSRSERSTAPLHDRLVSELRDLFDEIHQTAVYVTHDVAEAFALGNRVAVMRAGRILQVASPEQLWAAPADAWVARFIGLAERRGARRDVARHAPGRRRPPPRPRTATRSSSRRSATGRW